MTELFFFNLFFFFVFGLIIGSFLNCLAWRLYKEETVLGRSHCPKCLVKIKWFDNIPVLSFLALKGKCRFCRDSISWQYPIVELSTAVLFALAFFVFSDSSYLMLIKILLAVSVLVLVFIFDFFWYLIPVSALFWSSVVILPLVFLTSPLSFGAQLFATIISVLVATIFFAIQYFITKGRGLGEGDIWLGAFIGLFFSNLGLLFVALLSAYFTGSIVGLLLVLLGGKKMSSKIPLGVFLVLGTFISLFFGQNIMTWYLELLRY